MLECKRSVTAETSLSGNSSTSTEKWPLGASDIAIVTADGLKTIDPHLAANPKGDAECRATEHRPWRPQVRVTTWISDAPGDSTGSHVHEYIVV